jgi:hypothetical protein
MDPEGEQRRAAARAFGEGLMRHALNRPMDWPAEAERASVEIEVLGYGPDLDPLKARAEPGRALMSARLPLNLVGDMAEVVARLGGAAQLAAATGAVFWGLRAHIKELPADVQDLATFAAGVLAGPYPPETGLAVAGTVPQLCAQQWVGIQSLHLAEQGVADEMGVGAEELGFAYVKAFLPKDVVEGVSELDSTLAHDDAVLRERYAALARARRGKGDLQAAALFSLAAITTLEPDLEVSSAARFTVTNMLLGNLERPVGAVLDLEGHPIEASAALTALLDEFGDLSDRWDRLLAKRSALLAGIGSLAEEGMAVWREMELCRLVAEGAIQRLPFDEEPYDLDAVGHRYAASDASSPYVTGPPLVEAVAARSSRWFVLSNAFPTRVLKGLIRMLANRMTVDDLEALDVRSSYAPDRRLRALAEMPELNEQTRPWIQVMYDTLDVDTPGLITTARAALERHETRR